MAPTNPIRTVWAGQHAVSLDAEVALIAAPADSECIAACLPCQHGVHAACIFPNCHDEDNDDD